MKIQNRSTLAVIVLLHQILANVEIQINRFQTWRMATPYCCILLSNREKATVFARYFISSCNDSNYDPTFRERKEAFKQGEFVKVPSNILPGDDRLYEPFEAHELFNAVRQCKLNSSAGDELISYMFKHMSKSSLRTILSLFNNIWRSGYVPSTWKHSIIIAILKPKKEPSLTSSYRPISLTAHFGYVQAQWTHDR